MRRAILTAVVIVLLAPLMARPGEDLEYQVKAAFLFNFLKFVEWPAAASAAGSAAPWVIGILGRDPFGGVLEDTVRGKSVAGRAIEVRHYTKAADVKVCNILFIGRGEAEQVGTPVQPGLLTVGETPGFLNSGGVINFYLEDNRVHFAISPAAAHSSGLRVSPQLLRLGKAL